MRSRLPGARWAWYEHREEGRAARCFDARVLDLPTRRDMPHKATLSPSTKQDLQGIKDGYLLMQPRRLGVLLNESRCAYSYAMADELDLAASSRGVELEYLPVAWAGVQEEADQNDLLHLLEHTKQFDGLVILSSVFNHNVKSLKRFTQTWWPRPASSIGFRLPLVPSVLVDNRRAMYTATRHLITEHNRSKIVFIRGRSDSQEATDRYFGFRQALRESNILGDSARVLEGDFTRQSAVAELSRLSRAIDFDAVLASNDEMALAVVTELEARGLRIPEQVSVIGFDDVPAASKGRVALTTMRQPFDLVAQKAIELVLDQCEEAHVSTISEVPVQFIHRASCGCGVKKSLAAERLA